MTRLLGWLAIALASGCLESNAVQCGDKVCPPESACDVVHGTCVKPSQLQSCAGADHPDGEPCGIESNADGICDQNICVIERCGDGYIRGGEQCDGDTIPAGANCTDLNFYVSATPTCTPDCTFDLASCEQRCGDGMLQPELEICEAGIDVTASCVDYGFGAGMLGCINCGPETSQCIPFGWDLVDVPGGGVIGLTGTSATDVYAMVVGGAIAHFDGSKWTPMDLSSCGLAGEMLHDLYAPAAGVVFAYGDSSVIRLMNGACTKWTVGVIGSSLQAVWAASATEAWVSVNSDGMYRFDGAAWSRVLVLPGNETVTTIWGSGPNDVYTAGYDYKIRHYAGTFGAPFFPPGLAGAIAVWGSGSQDVYAAGLDSVGAVTIVRYNGTGWTTVLSDHPLFQASSATIVRGLKTGGRNFVFGTTQGPTRVMVLVDDGNGWVNLDAPVSSAVPMWAASTGQVFTGTTLMAKVAVMHGSERIDRRPGVGGTSVPSLTALGADDVYAVVSDNNGELYHWDGLSWTKVQALTSSNVRDVDVSPSGIVYVAAVGELDIYPAGGPWVSDSSVGGDHLWPRADNDVWVMSSQIGNASLRRYHSAISTDTVVYPTSNGERMGDLWGTSATDVFLVGVQGAGDTAAIFHYDGTFQPMTAPAGVGALVRLVGNAHDDIYAIGIAGELLHYDGAAWTRVSVPAAVNDVHGTAKDLFAATYTGLLHFDGTTWTAVASGAPVGVSRLDQRGDTLMFLDYFGDWHQIVRTVPW